MVAVADLNFTRLLPKAELHAHLSGSIRRDTLHDIWQRKRLNGECINLEDPLTAINPGVDGFVDVVTFFPLFDKYIYALCNDIESVRYATEQVIKDFEDDGVRHLELRTTPRGGATTGMSNGAYVEAVSDVIHQWNQSTRTTIKVYLILSIDRRMTAEEAMDIVDMAVKYQYNALHQAGYVVGVDLCGNPTKGDPAIFTPAFSKAKQHKLGITAHFAEVPESSTDHELWTILSWKPDRLGHCIHVSPTFKNEICMYFIGLELCLSCNILAGLTSGGFSKHHLSEWLQRDCPIALSTDDVGIFGSPLSKEYAIAADTFLLSREDMIEMSRSAVSIAFAGRKRMEGLLDEFEKDMKMKQK